MAIAFDAESNSGTTGWPAAGTSTLTWSHTCTGSNRILIVGVGLYAQDNIVTTTSGVTYNGVAMTLINSISGTADALKQDTSLWYLINPATGANNIVATSSRAIQYHWGGGTSYTGVTQSSPIDSSATGQSGATGSTAATSLTVSTIVLTNNCWLVGTVFARGGTPAAGTGTTIRSANAAPSAGGGDSNAIVSTGSQSLQWTSASGAYPGAIVASIKPTATYGTSRMLMGVGM